MTVRVDDASASVPPGCWAVGVSGGADSVALLLLLRERSDLSLHVVHLDHETRGGASADDARFVRDLASRLRLPCTIEQRAAIEAGIDPLPTNTSARFRAARLTLFCRAVREHDLAGVILAHHADDQAETVLHRLLRGSGPAGLGGMAPQARVGGLTVVRPLLDVRRDDLRRVLSERGHDWREDVSNASDDYFRNRLRRLLCERPELTDSLLRLGSSCRRLRDWLHTNTPAPGATLSTRELLGRPAPVRRELARRWLEAAGVPRARVEPDVVGRLIAMAEDAATPALQHFPGGVVVGRSRGTLSVRKRRASER